VSGQATMQLQSEDFLNESAEWMEQDAHSATCTAVCTHQDAHTSGLSDRCAGRRNNGPQHAQASTAFRC
jgi:hypothetical protein